MPRTQATSQGVVSLGPQLARLEPARQLAIMAESAGPLAEWITTEQAARYYGTSKSTLYRLADDGKVRKSPTGRKTRWSRSDLERYVFGI